MNGVVADGKIQIGTLEAIVITKKRPPANCSMGCPEFMSKDICFHCYRRETKAYEKTVRPVAFDQTTGQIVELKEG